MTKVQTIKEHISLRERFFGIKYNPLQYAYGFFRCLFHSKDTIEAANKGLQKRLTNPLEY